MNRQPKGVLAQRKRDRYLKALSRRLWALPAAQRSEMRREMESHLDMLVAEQNYLNSSPMDATDAALRQFGKPSLVGRRLAWQWHRENTMKTPRLIGALGLGAVLISSLWLVGLCNVLSHILLPTDHILMMGREGAKMSVHNGVVQVASGEVQVIGLHSLGLGLAIGVPFAVILAMAVVGCLSMVRGRPISARA